MLLLMGMAALVAGGAGGIWAFKQRENKLNTPGHEGDGMVTMVLDSGVRVQFWAMAAEQWVDHPIVGAGSRSYSYECFRYWNPNLPTSQANPEFVHNEYLQLLADYGLVGLLLILGLLAWHFYLGGRRIRTLAKKVGEDGLKSGSNAMALTIAGMCGMTAMSVHIISDFRTHLLANLLLLVCCAIWVLPIRKFQVSSFKFKVERGFLAACLVGLGLGAMGLGIYQLWGGMPLLKAKIAKEDGAWDATKVDRMLWIPALEESARRVPTDLRLMRLGTLYQAESLNAKGDAREDYKEKAKRFYEASLQRNPYNPIPRINLAAIYADEGDFSEADRWYASASEMAKARERWFRMHSEWAKMHQRWAVKCWEEKKPQKAEEHFLRAVKLFKESYKYGYFYQQKQWNVEYSLSLISYARYLDSQRKYQKAESYFVEAKKQTNWYHWQTDTHLNYYYSKHLYEYGYSEWQKRQPERAMKLMQMARLALLQYRGAMKGRVNESWVDQMQQIQEVIDFLENAGIGKSEK